LKERLDRGLRRAVKTGDHEGRAEGTQFCLEPGSQSGIENFFVEREEVRMVVVDDERIIPHTGEVRRAGV